MCLKLLRKSWQQFRRSLAALPQSKSVNRTKGDQGELEAYEFLRRNGYKIVARNYRRKCGEIDLIGWDQNILAFVEVKRRLGDKRGRPEEAVHRTKQKQICRTANEYRVRHHLHDINYRFDVISIQERHLRAEWLLIKNAFVDHKS